MNERTGSEGTRLSSGKRTKMSVPRATATARLNNDWSVAKGARPQNPGVWRTATLTDNRRATNCAGASFHHHRPPRPRGTPPRPGSPRPLPARPALLPAGNMALCEAASSLYWPRVLLFGDSITQFSFQQGGWGASLADKLVRKCDVLNRGFSGYNTRWAKIILPRLIKKGTGLDSPVAVTIFFGANDSALKGCKLNRRNLVVGEYAGACLQVARDCGTDVLDLWTLMQKDGQDFSSFLSDGLHLSPDGNEFLFSHLWPLIEKKVSSLPLLLPYWRDVAEAKPELSLLGDGDH
ncbi:isoamyl acetate-hydrolyzing [Lynx pardinus]|uniref:Isoamyl acetate-hydrolyzing esterase 1 homolog n=1 Tax=Lynx pardinus TaxID=191816 RepID=A0A485N8R4_LYNPA|nr:isoamyl acetate-hydrolyzing [Lynx pardinus]